MAQNKGFDKERFQLAENLRGARRSPFIISKVLVARMRKLITARARKNKRPARMLANARKDHSITPQKICVNTYRFRIVFARPHYNAVFENAFIPSVRKFK